MAATPEYDYHDPEEVGESEEERSFSPLDALHFALSAVRQHLFFCLAVAVAVSFLGAAVVISIPPSYEATFKIFVQDGGMVTSALTSGSYRYRPIEAARGMREFIFAQDNLLAVAKEADLYERWPESRPLPLRIKDELSEAVVGPASREDMERMFAAMLRGHINAAIEGESIRVRTYWRDPESAYELAELVKRNFLAARASYDLGPIRRAIPFLEEQLAQADEELERAVQHLQTLTQDAGKSMATVRQQLRDDDDEREGSSGVAEAASLSRKLSNVRQRRRELADSLRRRRMEFKTQLIDAQASLSDQHPKVLQLKARIAAMSDDPEELQELKQEEERLLESLSSGRRRARRAAEEGEGAPQAQGQPEVKLDTAEVRLSQALRKSDEIARRLQNARTELATAEMDFKHRYVVIEEPEVPPKPLNAKKKALLFVVVLVASMLLGVAAAVGRQLARGRLEESWQVRMLGPPLLAEVSLNRLPPPKS